jgi:hypothetical protein
VLVSIFQVARDKVVAYTRADLTKGNLDHEVIDDLPPAYST